MNNQSFKVLVYGGKGWIGSQIVDLLSRNNVHTIVSDTRVTNYQVILAELKSAAPTHVICCIGKTSGAVDGKEIKTIDYLEYPGKLTENVGNNLYAPMILAQATAELNIHMTYMGTGCIFSYLQDNPEYQFTETDYPNFFGSSYSVVKGFTDTLMKNYPNVLNVRIRMPIAGIPHPREFITKIVSYDNICSIPNSMTVLDDVLPVMLDMALKGNTGTINLTNPGVITHNEVLEMYRALVDPNHVWNNVTYDEQMTLIVSHRSNNHLSTEKLQSLYPNVNDIKTAVMNALLKRKHQMGV